MTHRDQTHSSTPQRRRGAAPASITTGAAHRILVVDGDHRVRDSLADLIGLAEGVEVVGTTSQTAQTLEAIERLDPGVVVIDPYLPDLDAGLALIRTLRAIGRTIRIVATCRDDGLAPLALAAGADACVDRCADPIAFQEAVLAAACQDVAPMDHPGHASHPAHRGSATPDDRSMGTR